MCRVHCLDTSVCVLLNSLKFCGSVFLLLSVAEKERCYTFNDVLHRFHGTSIRYVFNINNLKHTKALIASFYSSPLPLMRCDVDFPIPTRLNVTRQKWINNSIGINYRHMDKWAKNFRTQSIKERFFCIKYTESVEWEWRWLVLKSSFYYFAIECFWVHGYW